MKFEENFSAECAGLKTEVELLERLRLTDLVDGQQSYVPTVDCMGERVHQVAVEAMRFGVRQAFAVGRTHYSNINLEAMSQGFPVAYTEEELDEIEEEATPFASVLVDGMKDDTTFPFPLLPK